MKFTLVILVLGVLLAPLSFAEVALNRANMENYFSVMEALKPLETRYADDFARMDEQTEHMTLSDGGKQLAEVILAQPFAGEVKTILRQHGFPSVEDFSNFSVRLLSGVMMQSLAGSQGEMAQAMAQFDAQMAQMKQSGQNPEMIKQMEASMAEGKRMLKEMQAAEKNLTSAEKQAIAQNFDWLQVEFEKMDQD